MRHNNVAEIGEWLIEAASNGDDVVADLDVETGWVLDEARRIQDPRIEEFVGLAVAHLAAVGDMPVPELFKTARVIAQFGLYTQRIGAVRLDDIDPALASRFVVARSRYTTKRPGYWTRHARTRILRNGLTVLRRLGHVTHLTVDDPLSEAVPAVEFRPLTDEEVRAGQLHSRARPDSTREPAVWALGRATATSAEIPRIQIEHVDLDNRRVWSPGGPKNRPRWLHLDDWGVKLIGVRIAHMDGAAPSTRLTNRDWQGSPGGPQVSTCRALGNVMKRAGLVPSPGVRTSSLAAWAGRSLYGQTGDLAAVARRMGIKSLDTTADRIGLHWQPDNDD